MRPRAAAAGCLSATQNAATAPAPRHGAWSGIRSAMSIRCRQHVFLLLLPAPLPEGEQRFEGDSVAEWREGLHPRFLEGSGKERFACSMAARLIRSYPFHLVSLSGNEEEGIAAVRSRTHIVWQHHADDCRKREAPKCPRAAKTRSGSRPPPRPGALPGGGPAGDDPAGTAPHFHHARAAAAGTIIRSRSSACFRCRPAPVSGRRPRPFSNWRPDPREWPYAWPRAAPVPVRPESPETKEEPV